MTDAASMLRERLDSQIKDITSAFETAGLGDIRSVPEDVFVQVYLPLFAGEKELKYPVTTRHWANIAGNVFMEVNIVDRNGKILFKVPPLMNNKAVNPIADGVRPIAEVVASAKQYANLHPSEGVRYLDEELYKRNMLMQVPTNVLADIDIWNSIFERYGYPKITDITAETKTQQSQGSDDLEYDFEPL